MDNTLLMAETNNAQRVVRLMKKDILKMAHRSGEGHIASSFSVLDIVWILYDKILKITDEASPFNPSDKFILSKGHASMALYCVLARKGFISNDTLESFCSFESILGGHPDSTKCRFIDASTGSLGHGLPFAVGLAMGARIRKQSMNVFCLIGDGECNEGTVWESVMLSAHHKLTNLCCIIDYNHSTDRALQVGDLAEKFRSFGWCTKTIDGHNHDAILHSTQGLSESKPTCIIAETKKGKGIDEMENDPNAWHHRCPTSDELKKFELELDSK